MLVIKKSGINIVSLFKKYLEDISKPIYNKYCGCDSWYDDWDDYGDYYGDGYDYFFDGVGYPGYHQKKKSSIGNVSVKKQKKRGKRGSGKKSKCVPLYNNINSEILSDNLYDNDEVTIYFYRDINDPDNKEIFYSLYDFNEFLDSEGIYVSQYETRQLLNRSISHCCIDSSFGGEPWLLSDSSYGGLAWSVCHDNDEVIWRDSMASNNSDLPY